MTKDSVDKKRFLIFSPLMVGIFVVLHTAKLIFFKVNFLFFHLGQKGTPLVMAGTILSVTFFFLYLLLFNKRKLLVFFYLVETVYLMINFGYFIHFQSYLIDRKSTRLNSSH